jgi:transposase
VTGGNRNDVTQLIPLIDAVPALRGKVGRPRRRPATLVADRAYDHDSYRRELRRRGIRPLIARRRTGHGSGLGRLRWPVERSLAWLHQFRRLLVRFERRRHPRGIPDARLLPHLLQEAPGIILKSALRELRRPAVPCTPASGCSRPLAS